MEVDNKPDILDAGPQSSSRMGILTLEMNSMLVTGHPNAFSLVLFLFVSFSLGLTLACLGATAPRGKHMKTKKENALTINCQCPVAVNLD